MLAAEVQMVAIAEKCLVVVVRQRSRPLMMFDVTINFDYGREPDISLPCSQTDLANPRVGRNTTKWSNPVAASLANSDSTGHRDECMFRV